MPAVALEQCGGRGGHTPLAMRALQLALSQYNTTSPQPITDGAELIKCRSELLSITQGVGLLPKFELKA